MTRIAKVTARFRGDSQTDFGHSKRKLSKWRRYTPAQVEVQKKPKKRGKSLKKRKKVVGNSTPPPDSEATAEPKLVPAVEEHLEDAPYHVNSDTDFEDNVTDGNKDGRHQQLRRMEEVKASMEVEHGNQEEEGEAKIQ